MILKTIVVYINKNKKWFVIATISVALVAYDVSTTPDTSVSLKNTTATSVNTLSSADAVSTDGVIASGTNDLILSPDLIRRFDFYLNAINEKPLEQIIQAVTDQFKIELNALDAQEATRLFLAYINYKQALANVSEQPHSAELSTLINQLKKGREIRSRFFTPTESAALFGEDDRYDDYTAKRLEIQLDQTIPDNHKAEMLDTLKSTLSSQTIDDITEPMIHITLSDRVEQARLNGANSQEVYRIRSEIVGEDAALRLEQLDIQEAQWQQRVEQYKTAIEQTPEQAETIKQTMFTPQEQLRIDTIVHTKK